MPIHGRDNETLMTGCLSVIIFRSFSSEMANTLNEKLQSICSTSYSLHFSLSVDTLGRLICRILWSSQIKHAYPTSCQLSRTDSQKIRPYTGVDRPARTHATENGKCDWHTRHDSSVAYCGPRTSTTVLGSATLCCMAPKKIKPLDA